jgi:hypothetical protein
MQAQQVKHAFLSWSFENDVLLLEGKPYVLDRELNFVFQSANELHSFSMSDELYVACTPEEQSYLSTIGQEERASFSLRKGIAQKKWRCELSLFPLRKKNGQWEKLLFASLTVEENEKSKAKKAAANAAHSVLQEGDWYKIGVQSDGVYRLTYDDLSSLGLSMSTVNPAQLKLYGQPAGMLPYHVSIPRGDDLEELPIQVIAGADGTFDQGDYILFYGESPHRWKQGANGRFQYQQHYYSDYTFYFLTQGDDNGRRIENLQPLSTTPTSVVNSFDDYAIHESEEVNLVKSGRNWYGERFSLNNNQSFSFNFPNIEGEAFLKASFVAYAESPYNSSFQMQLADMGTYPVNINGTSSMYTKGVGAVVDTVFTPSSAAQTVNLSYATTYTGGEGWLDYLLFNVRRKLKMHSTQLHFRDAQSVAPGALSQFSISNASSSLKVWEVSDPLSVQEINGQFSSGVYSFTLATDTLRAFVAFTGGYKTPSLHGAVANQDLHAHPSVDLLIVSHPDFWSEAERLANFHREKDALTVGVVSPQQIYNEFSSGAQDVSAIRDFARLLYNREDKPLKYLLLFGDASYDPKNRIADNTNYIVSYQSDNSKSEISSYVTDDFFAILDEGETITNSTENHPFLDIGVGRFPVKTMAEAKVAVDKVEAYVTEQALGDWRLKMCFVGDDNDVVETSHTGQAESLADTIKENHPVMNVDKVYLDAFEQESTPGGQRCSEANRAITEQMERGVFLMNYNGHGGEMGWAHERILGLDDISSWSNADRLPIFMTATCEFSRYDDPERTSAGEYVFLQEGGGAIALLTTSRVVFTGSNLHLNNAFLAQLFERNEDGSYPRIGDLIRRTKNTVKNKENTNHRNFTLLGDPALCLAYPKYHIRLTSVTDSVQALGEVSFEGEVFDDEGAVMSDFNGYVYPTVFDKRKSFQTLGQDASNVLSFDLQKNQLFKGKATVKNGRFSFSFVVPKDIDYSYGAGKVSLYAEGSTNAEAFTDAAGYDLSILVGGTADEVQEDVLGPEIQLFMNDTNFLSGGVTNQEPELLALLYDEHGINTVGNGIGHDIVAVLDENTANAIILNDFYESEADSYQRGQVRYPFSQLSEGKHQLRIKVWDVFNNSAEASTDFVVVKSANLTIENLLNYPNPMVDYTAFYFEHNQAHEQLEVRLDIIDMQGRVVSSIEESLFPSGYRYGPIQWRGQGSQGAKLSAGIYAYRLVAVAADGQSSQQSGRLVISE